MRTGFLISRILKTLKAPSGDDRLARALFVANAVGFHVPLSTEKSFEQSVEEHGKFFRDICGAVNENLALDTKKAQSLFREVLRIRHELISGVIDPAIVQAALSSSTMEDGVSRQEYAMSEWLANRGDFVRAQLEIADVLKQANEEG